MRDHRPRIALLHLGRKMALRHPRRAEPERIRELHLLEEVAEHRCLIRQISADFRLADGEEDVELHGFSVYPERSEGSVEHPACHTIRAMRLSISFGPSPGLRPPSPRFAGRGPIFAFAPRSGEKVREARMRGRAG